MSKMQRREFLTTAGRYALYAAFGVIAAASLKKARPASEKACPPHISCRDCNRLRGCNLEEAEEARSAEMDLNS
ncbi:MAG: hypothetical protein EA408_02105 [Marinilabiliales bacterium]|nr:MAG: hypothetical protein EA408_02105 [Marinilabiliales bacterium]